MNNKILGEYLVGKTIGEGAFSKVKLATHIATNQKMAIKVIDQKLIKEKAAKLAKAQQEAERVRIFQERKMKALAENTGTDFSKLIENNSNVKKIDTNDVKMVQENSMVARMQVWKLNFQSEVQLMMRLDHPNIIKVYQVIESEEESLIVM